MQILAVLLIKLHALRKHASCADSRALLNFHLSLQLACLSHFQTQEFSHLMSESSEDVEAEISQLPKPARQRLLELLDLPIRSTAAGALLKEARMQGADWKLAVKILRGMAVGVGHRAGIFICSFH